MNQNEDNFESLRRVLALKRHEIPPPGYFDRFSANVIAQLRAAPQKENIFVTLWNGLRKGLEIFESKPAFAGVFASALCLLLLLGVVSTEQTETLPQAILNAQSPVTLASITSPGLLPAAAHTGIISSTNPVFEMQSGNYFGGQNPLLQQVGFSIPGQ